MRQAQRERPPLWDPTAHSPVTAQRSHDAPACPLPLGDKARTQPCLPVLTRPQAALGDRRGGAPFFLTSPGRRPQSRPQTKQGQDSRPLGGPSGEDGCFDLTGGQTRKCAMYTQQFQRSELWGEAPKCSGRQVGKAGKKVVLAANTGRPKHPRPGEQREGGWGLGASPRRSKAVPRPLSAGEASRRRTHAEQFKDEPEDAWRGHVSATRRGT